MALFSKPTGQDRRRAQTSLHSGLTPPSTTSNLSPARIAVGYGVIAILWIAFSDQVVTDFGLPPVMMTIKGALFVLVTALLLYFTIRRLVDAAQQTSEGLRDTETHLAEAQRLSHTGSWYLDIVHNRLSWSDEVFRIFGMEPGTPLTYENFLATVHPEDRTAVDQAWKEALLGAPYEIEHRILVGQELRWVRERAQLQFDADGKAIRGIGTVQDITERRAADEVLRERADLLNLTHDTVFVMNMDGVIKYWNRGAEDRYGWKAEEAAGRVVHDLLKTVFPSRLEEIKADLLRTGRWEGELLHTRKDGTQLVAASRWALQRDQQGAPVAILETNNDITERKRAEEVIRRHEEELRQVLNVAPQLVAEFGPKKERLYVNQPTLDYFGVTLEEWRNTSDPFRFYHPEDREWVAYVYAGSPSDVPREFEARMRKFDGTYRWFLFREGILRDEQGCVKRWYLAATDIEDRKHAEEERRQSAERFRAIADYTYDWENWFGVDGKLLWVNPAAERITGYSVHDCMAMPDFPLPIVAEADRPTFAMEMREAVRGSSRNDFEFQVLKKDGCQAWVAASWQPIYDSQGVRLGYRSSIRDIALRKRAEEALRESETRFRTFVDHAGDALLVQDLESGTIVDANRQACESLGFTREELLGKTPALFHLDSEQLQVESHGATGESAVFRHLHRRKNGTLFPVEVNTSSFCHGGRRLLLMVARDITDRVQAEEQRDKLRQVQADLAHINRVSMLGELAASVSHELKQPIAAASLHAETCLQWLRRDHPDIHSASEAATRILNDANRADEIIDRLRSLYKKSPPKRELVDLNRTIREMSALLLAEAGRSGVSIRVEIADELPRIMADGVQLQQVLMNLMLNAIDAMRNAGGTITVKAQQVPGGEVEISVSDTGIGLPEGKADRIFEAFFTTKAQGSGMGLSISRSIIESHGGRIWATSNNGLGASFHFVLPTALATETATGDTAAGITHGST